MKNIICLTLAALFLFSCGEPITDLDKLEAKQDSLRKAFEKINGEIAEVQEQIVELQGDEQLVQVTGYEVKKSDFDHYFSTQGNVEAEKNAILYPEAQGLIKAIYVTEGQRVTKGQKLMSVDTEIVQKSISEVQTNLDLATEVFERQKRLWEQNIGSEIQFLESKSRKESLESSLGRLQKQAGMGTVRAPFTGVVDRIFPKIGEMASPMAPVAQVVNLDVMYIKANVSENYLGKIQEGTPVNILINGTDSLTAKIDRIGNVVNPENRTFEITVNLEDKSMLKPNMFALININDIHFDEALVIPSSMIQQDTRGNEFVYTLNKQKASSKVKKTIIHSGASYDNQTVITSGLSESDVLVRKGDRKVGDGDDVAVISIEGQKNKVQ